MDAPWKWFIWCRCVDVREWPFIFAAIIVEKKMKLNIKPLATKHEEKYLDFWIMLTCDERVWQIRMDKMAGLCECVSNKMRYSESLRFYWAVYCCLLLLLLSLKQSTSTNVFFCIIMMSKIHYVHMRSFLFMYNLYSI